MSKKIAAVALATCLAAAAMPASATTITNAGGTFNFSGIDWAQGGTAFATGFAPVATTNFTLTYFASAVTLMDGITPFIPTGMDISPNGTANGLYEYTIVATLNETVNGCVGTLCSFAVNSGTWNIYYDTAQNANALAGALGTGFGDGISIMSGNVNPLASSFFDIGSGANSTTLTGQVTATNTTYVTPPFSDTTATTTLQLGNAQTSWVDPGGYNGTAWTLADYPIFQADGNQSFTTVPEPGSLALLGLGLGVLGWGVRRRQQAA